jgi:chemotaxis protein CheD
MEIRDSAIDIFLQPGEYFVGDADYVIRTLLGSCVSITLWHPIKRIGAMSHFLLPSRNTHAVTRPDGRYGEEAMWLMLSELEQHNIRATECEGKIFGGGNMFPAHKRSDASHVGQKNGEVARTLLYSHDIKVVSESLFGVGHRQVIFDVASGDVWARQVQMAETELREKNERY